MKSFGHHLCFFFHKGEKQACFSKSFQLKKRSFVSAKMVVMKNEKRELAQQNEGTANNQPMQQRASDERARRGPFTYAAGWLGTAFDRTQISHREAQDRRSRNM